MLRTARTNPTKSKADMDNVLKVFRELEAHTRPDAILATNTSSLGVANIAEGLARLAALIGECLLGESG